MKRNIRTMTFALALAAVSASGAFGASKIGTLLTEESEVVAVLTNAAGKVIKIYEDGSTSSAFVVPETTMNKMTFIVDTGVAEVSPKTASYKHDIYPVQTPLVQFNSKTSVKVIGDIRLKVGDGFVYVPEDTVVVVADALDEGTIAKGKDYYVHLTSETNFVVSLQSSVANARKIGGFHTICRNVSATLKEAPSSVFGDNLHPLAGWNEGDILPKSVWALNFTCVSGDPLGMVYLQKYDIWVDIYNSSGAISSPESKFGGPRIHTVSATQAEEGIGNVGKRLLASDEFFYAALGSNCGTVVKNGATNLNAMPNDPQNWGNNDYTGGRIDTANYPMISEIGCEEMCGCSSQWLRDICGGGGSATGEPLNAFNSSASVFGKEYGTFYQLYAGGAFRGTAANCGPAARSASAARSYVSVSFGLRGCGRRVSH